MTDDTNIYSREQITEAIHGHQIDDLVEHFLKEAVKDGYPPRNIPAWKRKSRQEIIANEHANTGYILDAWFGLKRRKVHERTGRRVTGWRYVWRHGEGFYDRDPLGTDPPPTDAWKQRGVDF